MSAAENDRHRAVLVDKQPLDIATSLAKIVVRNPFVTAPAGTRP
ncbi:hypothetical protein [Sphingomonas faeni]